MNLNDLFEETEICALDSNNTKLKNIASDAANADLLNTIKECILSNKEFSVFDDDCYTAEKIAYIFINTYDSSYNIRKNPCLLEHDLTPFSSYIIFHVANVQIKDIRTEFINPNCIYYCYLYLPIDESSEKAVIILKHSDNVGESIKNIILKNSHGEVIRGIDKIDDVLNLCTMALERVTQQEIDCYYQMLFIPYKQYLLSGNYIIEYTNKARRAMHNKRIIDLAFETIKNDDEPFFSTLEEPSNSNLYNEITKLIGFISAKNMTIIFGYYLYSMFSFEIEAAPLQWNELAYAEPIIINKPFALHVSYAHTDEILPLFEQLNKIFFNSKLELYEYTDKTLKLCNISSPACILCKGDIKKLCSDKSFKSIHGEYPMVILSKSKKEDIITNSIFVKIQKTADLSAVVKSANYTALSNAVLSFYQYTYDCSTDLSSAATKAGNIKCEENTFLKRMFNDYKNMASEKTPYCDKKKYAKLFFFVYFFLQFCLQKHFLDDSQANELNKKLFEFYFHDNILPLINKDEAIVNLISEDDVINIVTTMLKAKYESIPEHNSDDVTPCKITTKGLTNCILFHKSNFLNEFADWLGKYFPDETEKIKLVQQYISQFHPEKPDNIIRKALYEKNLLHTTSGKNFYRFKNIDYVAFISDKLLGK